MANAIINKLTFSGTLAQLSTANAYRDALLSVGYTLFDSYNASGSEVRVMALVQSAATRGTLYLQIAVNSTSNAVITLHDTWNTTTRSGTNSTTSFTISTVNGTTALYFYAINHPEFKGVVVEQGSMQNVLGILRPKGNPPTWWNENTHAYGFLAKYSTTPANSRFAATSTPFGNGIDHEYLQNSKLQDGNAQNSDARSILPLCILSAGVGGILASCDDLIVCASNTARPQDTVTVTVSEIYTYIWGNALNSGIAIRTA